MGESLLKKEFKSKDVNRARNLIKKDLSAKTIDGIGYTKTQVAYKEGDIWEESGRTWTIKNGIRQNITKLDSAKKALQTPLACPKCGGSMKHHLAQKMYKIHKMCFNCVVDYEAELRKAGLYESYERNMMQGSMKAFARDVEQWVLNTLSETNSFVTEQGDLEDWNSNTENFKKQLNSNLQEYLKHLKTHMED
jgi:hypothetical protein